MDRKTFLKTIALAALPFSASLATPQNSPGEELIIIGKDLTLAFPLESAQKDADTAKTIKEFADKGEKLRYLDKEGSLKGVEIFNSRGVIDATCEINHIKYIKFSMPCNYTNFMVKGNGKCLFSLPDTV